MEHRIVNLWAAEELSRLPHVSCIVRAYEVWSPLAANTVSDISDFIARKQDAMTWYTSQLHMIDYTHHILGLNAYRAMTEPASVRYAEAFLEAPSETYIGLVKHFLHT
jgi:LmbE family N-acetylglucosaminyl deacetylase